MAMLAQMRARHADDFSGVGHHHIGTRAPVPDWVVERLPKGQKFGQCHNFDFGIRGKIIRV